jgi:hypothetical protein
MLAVGRSAGGYKDCCRICTEQHALTVANLTTFLDDIDTKNSLVAQRQAEWDNSVEARIRVDLADR